MKLIWRRKIEDNYLVRWGIRAVPLTIFLHKYESSDPRESVHDHPWKWWISIVLKGYLIEEIVEGSNGNHVRRLLTRKAPHIHFSDGKVKHRIRKVKKGTVTLFFGIWRVREWYFYK